MVDTGLSQRAVSLPLDIRQYLRPLLGASSSYRLFDQSQQNVDGKRPGDGKMARLLLAENP